MKVMSVFFARWKRLKCTTEHATHVLCTYCMSLTSRQPNQVSCLCWGPSLQIVWELYKSMLGSQPAYCTVESHLKILAKCELGSEIHTDCMVGLKAIEEIGRLTMDNARATGNTSELATGLVQRVGGRRRRGSRQSG
ncbi:hypothetical protein CFP56_035690 [Quercus suber]|uniref:Uncharacterized protein n=1 Tax=Quercus suber TaxID=58331 RepID=A0AAW0J9T8_QUESU